MAASWIAIVVLARFSTWQWNVRVSFSNHTGRLGSAIGHGGGGAMILIVGATGDLGQRVVRRLQEQGDAIRALLRPETGASQLETQGVQIVRGDLTDPASLTPACEGVITVVLTATAIGRRLAGERVSIRDVDEVGGLALVDAAESAGVERFVYVSFPGADAGVGTSLERAKAVVEQRLQGGSMRAVIVRADAFQEIHLGPMARFDIANGKVSIVGRGNCERRWIATDDVAALIAALTAEPDPPNLIEVGGPQAISKNELVKVAEQASGRRIKCQHMPQPVARMMIRMLSKRNDALASALGAGLHQDRVPASWDDGPLRERGIVPTSPADFVTRSVQAGRPSASNPP
jgi:uncharacterized protein YbjT (DUF2867 family)